MKALLVLLALLLLAAPAHASTVRVIKNVEFDSDDDFGRDDTETVTAIFSFRAMPGEGNRVLVRRRGRRFVFTDRGAPLQAGRRCTAKGRHRAVCRARFVADNRFLSVGLGDRDDRAFAGRGVRLDGSWYGRGGDDRIHAGSGDDYVTGGPGDDTASGGAGRDQLLGKDGADRLAGGDQADTVVDGPGRDTVRGGPGADTLYSRDGSLPDRDRFDGGDDTDTVSYVYRRTPVSATLGGAGEDRLRRLENLTGGRGDDTLTGNDAANVIDGDSGADRMDGRGGDDRFVISFRDADHAVCGDGRDRIRTTFSIDYLVDPDCERVSPGSAGSLPANPVAMDADTVTVRLPCAEAGFLIEPARVELRIPARESAWYQGGGLGSVVGSGEVPSGRNTDRCDTVLTLNDAGRALVRPVPVQLYVGSTFAWHFQLR